VNALCFRRPSLEEAAPLAALHVQCWRESLTDLLPPEVIAGFDLAKMTDAWAMHLANPSRLIFAAYLADGPVGFVHGGETPAPGHGMDGHVFALYVAAAHHRKGLGRALLGLIAQAWLEQGGTGLSLGVLAGNVRAQAFYDAMGGTVVKTGTYVWHGHPLPDAIYHFRDLRGLAGAAQV
jgi:ribosomal protein S18 acetylase RimI-like enzyme